MIDCVNLNKRNMNNLKELSYQKWMFNPANEDFFEYYSICNFAQQIISKRRVRLIKQNEEYLGYIWHEPINKGICIIKSMFCVEKDVSLYGVLINNMKARGSLRYNCESNEYNNDILKELGFQKKEGVLELFLDHFELDKERHEEFINKNNLTFRNFIRGKDENLRCRIQNEVFDDENRIPLNIDDIYFDEAQKYYLENGALFLYEGNVCTGYGQIIFEDEIPHIVNVGILNKYQGLKYGRVLMNQLLNLIYEYKFKEVRLKVKSNNFKALCLYKSLGFVEKKETFIWELKR